MNKIHIGAVTDLYRTFVGKNVSEHIEQQVYNTLEVATMLKLDGDMTDFLMLSAVHTMPSTAILQHLELVGYKCTTDDIIRFIATLSNLVGPICKLCRPIATIVAIPANRCPDSPRAKFCLLTSGFKRLSVPWGANSVAGNIARVALSLSVMCPNLVYVDMSPRMCYTFSY
ncbi:hypothetical protein LPJ71_001930 [Coemansia sp. S17]|nr:hypothetical protein LPJ71_001930 [Coemansia sp. S17]